MNIRLLTEAVVVDGFNSIWDSELRERGGEGDGMEMEMEGQGGRTEVEGRLAFIQTNNTTTIESNEIIGDVWRVT